MLNYPKYVKFIKPFVKNFSSPCVSCHKYSEKLTCCVIAGDGVGPELIDAVQTVFKARSIPIVLADYHISKHDNSGIIIAIEAIRKFGVCLKTPFRNYEPALNGPYLNYNVRIRLILDVYAHVARIVSIPGVKTRHQNVDFYIIREQTEAAYSNIEHELVKGVVESLKVITRKKSKRIAKFAFDYATKLKRKSVACVHKANIMKLTDGLFLRTCEEVSKQYPNIKFKSLIVDNAMMQLVSNPQQFDVLVMPNLYGNIAHNLGAGLIGGAGMCPGAGYSADCVIFEPTARHIFADGVGKNIANPTAILLCAVKMLRHVNLVEYADELSNAIYRVLKEGKVRTKDIGGTATTTEFTKAIINCMKEKK